jgi:hypothetical protein
MVRNANGVLRYLINILTYLQVGITRHDDIGFSLSAGYRNRNEFLDVGKNLGSFFTNPNPHVSGNLIVSASASVELASNGTDELTETAFVSGMDILITRLKLESVLFPFVLNFFQTFDKEITFLF